jgi:predicted peptidase
MAPGKEARDFTKEVTKRIQCRYWLYLPEGYGDVPTTWPLILFLHGAGERGDDLSMACRHGPLKDGPARVDLPFVVVAPLCPAEQWWDLEILQRLLADVVEKHDIDEDRVYLTGLSMGGYAAWSLAIAEPCRYAAIAPVCGGGLAVLASRLRHLPVWAFHGARDTVVPLSESQRMVDSIRDAGGDARLTVYPEAEHDAWTEAYANPELYSWFLSHRRGARPKADPL